MNRLLAVKKIVETGSFTKAGEQLGYTQPAMSQLISSLEEEFSFKIFKRNRSGVRLTIEGEKILPFIENTLLHQQLLYEAVDDINGLNTGVIRIGTVSSISAHWLPILIQQFQLKYPNVEFRLHQGDYSSIPEWINRGEIDFGFINPDAVPDKEVLFLKSGELKAVVPQNHPLAEKDVVQLNQLINDPFLLLEEGSLSEPLEAFNKKNLSPKIKLKVHDDYSILSMIEHGLGISILPELVLRRISYHVKTISIKPQLYRKIGILSKDQNSLPFASKQFIDFIVANVDLLV